MPPSLAAGRTAASGSRSITTLGAAAISPSASAARSPTRVEAVKDGPLLLRGELRLQTPAGELQDVRAALCRCGLTENEPFCDHACKRAGWQSTVDARSSGDGA